MPSLEERHAPVSRFAADMRRLGPANFLYTDGEALFAHGHRRIQQDGTIAPPGLWYLSRECGVDTDALAQAGVAIETDTQPQQLTLFASVPLTNESWHPLGEGGILVVTDGQVLTAAAAATARQSLSPKLDCDV